MKPITETLRTRNRRCRQVNVCLKITSKETLLESLPLRCSGGGGVLAHGAPALTLCYLCKLKMATQAPSTRAAGAPPLRKEDRKTAAARSRERTQQATGRCSPTAIPLLISNPYSASRSAGSARTSGTTPIRATLAQMWWRTISPSSTVSGLESVL